MSQRSISQLFINPLGPRFKSVFATLSLTAAVAFASNTAVAQQPEHAHYTDHTAAHGQDVAATNAAAQRKAAIDSTETFISAHKQWAQARGASNKAAALQSLIAKTEARRELMAELIRTNPAEALRVAIPEDKQVGMPAEVLEMLEQKVELEGELESTYLDNFENPALTRTRHILKNEFGERFELHFTGKAPELPFGTKVRAHDLLLGNDVEAATDGEVALSNDEENFYPIAYAGSTEGGSNLGGLANDTLGEVRTLVMLVNFQDKREQPFTQVQARDLVFGQVSDFFQENSYGQSWLAGDVSGWHTLPLNSTDQQICVGLTIADAADAIATQTGYNLDNYDRVMYVFPNLPCGYGGAGQVGGTRTWINGTAGFDFQIMAHELGHNYGLQHAHSLVPYNGTSVGSGSPTTGSYPWPNFKEGEYGNTMDIMGDSPSGHFNAFMKQYLGWLDYGNSPAITEITQNGSYEIDVMASQAASSRPKALKVLKHFDPNTGWPTWYYVELRQPVGFDSWINQSWSMDLQNTQNGVLIHSAKEFGGSTEQWLLDMTPTTSTLKPKDPALVVGQTFNSPDGDLSITTEWVDANKAVVNIDFGGGSTPTCSRANPSLSFSPAQGPWVAAGTAVNYTVTVTNNDSSACSNSSYSLSASKPSGWSAGFNSSSLSLAPGASASTTLSVTSASSATDGFYNIGVTATSGSYSTNGAVTYVVDTPVISNGAPVANSDTAITEAGVAFTIAVLNNDSDPEGDSLGVTSVSGVNGTAVINSNGTITFTPASGFSGTEVFSYSISDGKGGSASASVTVTVNAAPFDTNSAPVAVNDSATMPSVAAITIAALANDSDPEGDTLMVQAVTQGVKGSVRINSDGTLTYTPGNRFKNADSFSYTISDGAKTATATVSVQLQKSTGGTNGKGNGKKR